VAALPGADRTAPAAAAVTSLKALINRKISFDNILSTGISAGIQPLALPLVPFVVVGVAVLYAAGGVRFPSGAFCGKYFPCS
jgi:hypothetical protein